MSAPQPPSPRFTRQLIWFVALWGAGVGAVVLLSLLLRFWIGGR
ncbi:MAG: DUF2474 domain-containing protein [Rhodopseudomonas palustris]|nr:DUF2474 domain-containing protein [Rhodopseudomonas faecalis]TAH67570.1 MAG: DUF2474 domain-containing protein [Rhodopseudomonas palustris]